MRCVDWRPPASGANVFYTELSLANPADNVKRMIRCPAQPGSSRPCEPEAARRATVILRPIDAAGHNECVLTRPRTDPAVELGIGASPQQTLDGGPTRRRKAGRGLARCGRNRTFRHRPCRAADPSLAHHRQPTSLSDEAGQRRKRRGKRIHQHPDALDARPTGHDRQRQRHGLSGNPDIEMRDRLSLPVSGLPISIGIRGT
jgi:hypothetical protein